MKRIVSWLGRLWRRPAPSLAPAPAVPPEDEGVRGCGWFDSSHELRAGLEVLEHASADSAALPLGDWLTLHLRDWRGPRLDAV